MYSLDEKYEITITELSSKASGPSNYTETLKNICTLTTAEELSYILHHIKSFSEALVYNLNVFKKGISASWEHPANKNGCSWTVQFKSESSNILFERILAYFCLEGFKTFKCNGLKFNIRKGFVKFEIWSMDVPCPNDNNSVLLELRNALDLDYDVEFIYKNHKELLEKVNSTATKETA
jgi:Eukaryotic initiation factor 4E